MLPFVQKTNSFEHEHVQALEKYSSAEQWSALDKVEQCRARELSWKRRWKRMSLRMPYAGLILSKSLAMAMSSRSVGSV
jgi:hypothetical protein